MSDSPSVTLAIGQLKALLSLASSDPTRENLSGIAIVDGAACATDGHALLRLSKGGAGGAEADRAWKVVSGAALRPMASFKGATTAEVNGKITVRDKNGADLVSRDTPAEGRSFPAVSQVIPSKEGRIRIGVNPELLAKVLTAMARAGTKDRAVSLYIEAGKGHEFEPILVVGEDIDSGMDVTAVVMPMRI